MSDLPSHARSLHSSRSSVLSSRLHRFGIEQASSMIATTDHSSPSKRSKAGKQILQDHLSRAKRKSPHLFLICPYWFRRTPCPRTPLVSWL